MSPLLFVLAMEYLSRVLKKIARDKEFRFHERCADLQLNHLCFVDDVVLFTHGDFKSVYRVLQGFELFSQSSGLQANYSKSKLISNGIPEVEVQRILSVSKLKRGNLPFQYLGIPISAKKFSPCDYEGLIDKMVDRIKNWSWKFLSFAGRLTLINSVLISFHTYWAHIVVLPKRVLCRINEICRAFLWKGLAEFGGPGSVAWDDVCKSKYKGGLGIRHIDLWNLAALRKYVWAIAANKENMWVKWIHSVYLKGEHWWEYEPPLQSILYWKKITEVKNRLKEFYSFQSFISIRYSITEVYGKFRGVLESGNLAWTRYIWNAYLVPKHAFITWLATLNRLKTKAQLHHIGVASDPTCLICGNAKEDGIHLFFSCCYSRKCITEIKHWLGWNSNSESLQGLLRWLARGKGIYLNFREEFMLLV
ncbi:uncharacterized protein LOC133795693 [Humulus lupulus]|uniref:uncharacterized protein LOC133795693 n=1 Tax=Humulus lupulus TaxID=3486 RepID=UPI002B40CAFA|nr:uncharacterized protein LOC133795693 [Humulus lupulus]